MRNTKKEFLTIIDVMTARERVKDICLHTSLIHSQYLSDVCGNEVYIKPENLQITGAFKLRGALNKITSLTDEQKSKGLVASSAGNHAQGVAYSAKKLGIQATIVMPKTTPLIKVESTKQYGANVVLTGTCYDDAYAEAKRLEEKHGYTFIHPFNDIEVMAGQGTIALEVIEDLKDVDAILVPIGGGGLISGIAVAAKSLKPDIKVIGVESEGAKAMRLSIDNNKLTNLDSVDTIADGGAVKNPGDLAFEIVKEYVDDIITISDEEVADSIFTLVEKHKIVAEATGALTIAALKKLDFKGKKVVPIISGGNIDILMLTSLLNFGLSSRKRVVKLQLQLKDAPGQISKISSILSEQGANIVEIIHDHHTFMSKFKQLIVNITIETNGQEHINNIVKYLNDYGYDSKVNE
ncbi:threonine ammonia-lyase [Clostridium frigidicarnis]|uniref:L-threonine dehydratase catabolic TdcB n=1 Tax=Clostridium frigidicarnis TaxID=84698 RepID=A0A1I1B5Q5_9CLOT|nr:threonine ammonia-lyase [Clostridium frigidicarnis]SFB45675.1 threonine dehydratase [Clostridium frigidicarnis]